MAKRIDEKRKKHAGKAHKRKKPNESSEEESLGENSDSETETQVGLKTFTVFCRKGKQHQFHAPAGYSKFTYLAEGSFGVVCTAKSPEGQQVVIKKLICDDEVNTESALRELHNLWWFTQANSVHVVKLLNTWTHKPDEDLELYLVVEKFAWSLNHYMDGTKKLSVPQWRRLCGMITNALYELHSCGAMHRDMKPENVVVDAKCTRIAIIDLGSVRSSDRKRSEAQPPLTPICKVTTEGYRGPETFIDDEDYDASLDVFGAGCLLAALRFRSEIFPRNSDLEEYLNSTDSEATAFLNEKFSSLKKTEREFLKAMLQREPSDRITADKLKELVPDSVSIKKLTPRYKEPTYVATSMWNMTSKIRNLVDELQLAKAS